MTTNRRGYLGLASVTVLAIGILFLGSVPQAIGETLTYKIFTRVTKSDMVPIGAVEGHVVLLGVREGVAVFSDGGWAWVKATQVYDFIKGAGPFDQYGTFTFADGSMIITRTKGTVEATPQGVSSAAKFTGDIIKGTGRFEGIKGTTNASSSKMFPQEKGELGPKSLMEGTFVYTLPGK